MCLRGRAKVLPHNPTKLSGIKNVVRYILQYAKDHASLLPGRIPGYKRDGSLAATSIVDHKAGSVQTLPLHSISRLRHKGSGLLPFLHFLEKLTPQVVVNCPTSDLCWVFQQNSNMILQAHNRTVEEKLEV